MRIAIISDVHSNLAALEAVLADAGAVGQVWCPGDLVGYGPNPNECVEKLRERHAVCVAGNHDWAAIGRLSTEDFNPDAAAAAHWTSAQLTGGNRSFLEDLPLTATVDSFTMAHGTLRNPVWEYLLSSADAEESFGLLKTAYCLVGHTHLPVVFVRASDKASSRAFEPAIDQEIALGNDQLILNPGSVGQPRDGNPAASYAVFDSDAKTIQYRRVPYDVELTQREMQLNNLPPRLWQRLSYGW